MEQRCPEEIINSCIDLIKALGFAKNPQIVFDKHHYAWQVFAIDHDDSNLRNDVCNADGEFICGYHNDFVTALGELERVLLANARSK